MKVKKVSCQSCGAPKMTSNQTCFVYCDFCAALIDFDFPKLASMAKKNNPDPDYYDKLNEYNQKLREYKEAGNKEEYYNLQGVVYELMIQNQPFSFSPRIFDPEYKKAYIEFTQKQFTDLAFVPELVELENRQDKLIIDFTSSMYSKNSKTDVTIREVIDAFLDYQKSCAAHFKKTGLLDQHPDFITEEICVKITASTFILGWSYYFGKGDFKYALEKSNLKSEFIEVDEGTLEKRMCGKCGAEILKAENAKNTICEYCGYKIDIEHNAFPCPGCGTNLSMPANLAEFFCPTCNTLIKSTKIKYL